MKNIPGVNILQDCIMNTVKEEKHYLLLRFEPQFPRTKQHFCQLCDAVPVANVGLGNFFDPISFDKLS